jgi:hypothetical protein
MRTNGCCDEIEAASARDEKHQATAHPVIEGYDSLCDALLFVSAEQLGIESRLLRSEAIPMVLYS